MRTWAVSGRIAKRPSAFSCHSRLRLSQSELCPPAASCIIMVRRKFFGQGEPEKAMENGNPRSSPAETHWRPSWLLQNRYMKLFPNHGNSYGDRRNCIPSAPVVRTTNRFCSQVSELQGWHMKILTESLPRPRLSVAMIVRDEARGFGRIDRKYRPNRR